MFGPNAEAGPSRPYPQPAPAPFLPLPLKLSDWRPHLSSSHSLFSHSSSPAIRRLSSPSLASGRARSSSPAVARGRSRSVSVSASASARPAFLDDADFQRKRHNSTQRLRAVWELILDKYGSIAPEDDDEVDLTTGRVTRDRGRIRELAERSYEFGELTDFAVDDDEAGTADGDDDDGIGGPEYAEFDSDEDELGDWGDRSGLDPQDDAAEPAEMAPWTAEDDGDLQEFLRAERKRMEAVGPVDESESDESLDGEARWRGVEPRDRGTRISEELPDAFSEMEEDEDELAADDEDARDARRTTPLPHNYPTSSPPMTERFPSPLISRFLKTTISAAALPMLPVSLPPAPAFPVEPISAYSQPRIPPPVRPAKVVSTVLPAKLDLPSLEDLFTPTRSPSPLPAPVAPASHRAPSTPPRNSSTPPRAHSAPRVHFAPQPQVFFVHSESRPMLVHSRSAVPLRPARVGAVLPLVFKPTRPVAVIEKVTFQASALGPARHRSSDDDKGRDLPFDSDNEEDAGRTGVRGARKHAPDTASGVLPYDQTAPQASAEPDVNLAGSARSDDDLESISGGDDDDVFIARATDRRATPFPAAKRATAASVRTSVLPAPRANSGLLEPQETAEPVPSPRSRATSHTKFKRCFACRAAGGQREARAEYCPGAVRTAYCVYLDVERQTQSAASRATSIEPRRHVGVDRAQRAATADPALRQTRRASEPARPRRAATRERTADESVDEFAGARDSTYSPPPEPARSARSASRTTRSSSRRPAPIKDIRDDASPAPMRALTAPRPRGRAGYLAAREPSSRNPRAWRSCVGCRAAGGERGDMAELCPGRRRRNECLFLVGPEVEDNTDAADADDAIVCEAELVGRCELCVAAGGERRERAVWCEGRRGACPHDTVARATRARVALSPPAQATPVPTTVRRRASTAFETMRPAHIELRLRVPYVIIPLRPPTPAATLSISLSPSRPALPSSSPPGYAPTPSPSSVSTSTSPASRTLPAHAFAFDTPRSPVHVPSSEPFADTDDSDDELRLASRSPVPASAPRSSPVPRAHADTRRSSSPASPESSLATRARDAGVHLMRTHRLPPHMLSALAPALSGAWRASTSTNMSMLSAPTATDLGAGASVVNPARGASVFPTPPPSSASESGISPSPAVRSMTPQSSTPASTPTPTRPLAHARAHVQPDPAQPASMPTMGLMLPPPVPARTRAVPLSPSKRRASAELAPPDPAQRAHKRRPSVSAAPAPARHTPAPSLSPTPGRAHPALPRAKSSAPLVRNVTHNDALARRIEARARAVGDDAGLEWGMDDDVGGIGRMWREGSVVDYLD
ncbi:hypothetical protein Q5752_004162 [Cryptotrichosporon argae]